MENNNKISKTLNPVLLNVEQVSHKFDYELFDNINLQLKQQESIAIIGISGTGKSTLLNIFCSLLNPNSGKVFFENKDIYSLDDEELTKLRRYDFGIIFQAHYLFRGFNAKQNLEISKLLSNNEIDMDLLKLLKIDHVLNQGVGELSGGQQQRLSIARILSKKPKIIFADEPTGNLDKDTAFDVIDALFDYTFKNNAGMILVTHERELAFRCDNVYELKNKKLEKLK
jgi:putative ABC transport system ATP-binding protein